MKPNETVTIFDAYRAIGNRCGLSHITIRNAFSHKPVTYQTAARIANRLGIPVECFAIKYDERGLNKKAGQHLDKGLETKKDKENKK